MRYIHLFLLLTLSFTHIWAQEQLHVAASFQQDSLKSIFQSLSNEYGLSFSYDESLIRGKSASAQWENIPLQEALSELLNPHGLNFEVLREKFILIKVDTTFEREGIAQYLCGEVLDKTYQTPLAYANIYLKRTRQGRVAGMEGEFAFTLRKLPQDSLIIQYTGYETLQIPLDTWEGCRTLMLEARDIAIEDIVISEYLTTGIEQSSLVPSLRFIPESMGVLPGLIEPDILQGIQLLPGVNSPEETASGVYVRGGTPDQNLVLWDRIPVYQTGHFFGMISAFNPYIVDEVEVFRGGFTAQYGNRVSGVIDIRTHEDLPDSAQGGLGLNMTHGYFFLKLPLIKNKLGLQFSLRRSFTDFLSTPTFNQYQQRVFQGTRIEEFEEISEEFDVVIPHQEFTFDDFTLSLHYQPGPRDHIRASLFRSHNLLDYQVAHTLEEVGLRDSLEQANGGLGLSWDHEWKKGHKTQVNFYSSEYTYLYKGAYFRTEPERDLFAGFQSNRLTDVGLEVQQRLQLGENHRIHMGYAFNALDLYYEIWGKEFGEKPVTEIENPGIITNAAFGGYRYEQVKKWWMETSLRYVRYPLIRKAQFEPRIGLGVFLTPQLQLQAHLGRYKQFLSQLILLDLNELGLGNQLWVLSDGEGIPLIRATQGSLGLSFKRNGWQIDGEAYHKRLLGISTLSATFGNLPEVGFSKGNARIRGVDFLIKKRWNHYRSWLSYSLGKVSYSFPTLSDKAFPASHDQRHTLSWGHILKVGAWEFGLGWNFASGKPFTPIEGVELELVNDEESDEEVRLISPILGPQNSRRLPAYHRMDLSAQYTFPQNPQAGWRATIGASLLNVYNRVNVLSRQYLEEEIGPDEGLEQDVFTLEKTLLGMTPNFVIRISW